MVYVHLGMISNIFNIFQELYVRKGITPKYDLVQIEGAVHEPTFKYRVTVGDAVATDQGGVYSVSNLLQHLKVANRHGSRCGAHQRR